MLKFEKARLSVCVCVCVCAHARACVCIAQLATCTFHRYYPTDYYIYESHINKIVHAYEHLGISIHWTGLLDCTNECFTLY